MSACIYQIWNLLHLGNESSSISAFRTTIREAHDTYDSSDAIDVCQSLNYYKISQLCKMLPFEKDLLVKSTVFGANFIVSG
jgi:hypothetical protein